MRGAVSEFAYYKSEIHFDKDFGWNSLGLICSSNSM
jgi:hypothetical protein